MPDCFVAKLRILFYSAKEKLGKLPYVNSKKIARTFAYATTNVRAIIVHVYMMYRICIYFFKLP